MKREETISRILENEAENENEALLDTTEDALPEEEPKFKVKFYGKEIELGLSDLIAHAQKGMNYDHVHKDLLNTRESERRQKKDMERLREVLAQYGYVGSPEEIADVLEAQNRDVKPEDVRSERLAQTLLEEIEELKIRQVLERDLAEIKSLDPNISTIEDLGELFMRLRSAGIGNLDAYEIASRPRERKAQGLAGKDHLIVTGGGASNGDLVDIPKGQLDLWKEAFPKDSMRKLKERYNNSLKA